LAQQAVTTLATPDLVPPAWERAAAALLRWASGQVRLIGCATPTNFAEQITKLERGLQRRGPSTPQFSYNPLQLPEVIDRLRRAADELGRGEGLATLYARRADELALEAEMCGVVGSPRLTKLARRRYAPRDGFDGAAEALARRWLDASGPRTPSGEASLSHDVGDPRSLLSRMRAEVGRRRLPVRVLVLGELSALAATGPGVVYVAQGKRLSPRATARCVLHEIEGHVLPRLRAAAQPLAIFALGSARGSDDQEGRALLLEKQADMLSAGRRRELGRRHLAALSMRQGANLVQTARLLMTDGGATPETAARIAARIHRGGGLGREIVYLPAMLRVQAAQRSDPTLEHVLRCGQVSVAAAGALARWCVG